MKNDLIYSSQLDLVVRHLADKHLKTKVLLGLQRSMTLGILRSVYGKTSVLQSTRASFLSSYSVETGFKLDLSSSFACA